MSLFLQPLLSVAHSRNQGRMVPILEFIGIAMHFWIENSPKTHELFKLNTAMIFFFCGHTQCRYVSSCQSNRVLLFVGILYLSLYRGWNLRINDRHNLQQGQFLIATGSEFHPRPLLLLPTVLKRHWIAQGYIVHGPSTQKKMFLHQQRKEITALKFCLFLTYSVVQKASELFLKCKF